jgi:predicted Zn-dependent protease
VAWREAGALPRGALTSAQSARLARAIRWNPMQPDYRLREAERFLVAPSLRLQDYVAAREAAETAIRLHPEEPLCRVAAARVEGRGCRLLFRDEASRARADRRYAEAEVLSPRDPLIPLERGGLLLSTGDPAGASSAAMRVLALEPNAVPARLLLAAARLAQGGPGARRSATALLAEAEAVAQRWADAPQTSDMARRLLQVDPVLARSIRATLGRHELAPPR